MPTSSYRGTAAKAKNFQQYAQMLEQAHQHLGQIEHHIKELVTVQKQSESRVYEDEHRNVTGVQTSILINGLAYPVLQFTAPQGEAWTIERVAGQSTDATVTQFMLYRDQLTSARLALVTPAIAGLGITSFYASGTHMVYIPERTTVYIVPVAGAAYSVGSLDGNIQVRVRKRYQQRITTEEAFALAGDYDEATQPPGGIEDDYVGDAPLEPHDERHGDVENTSGMIDTHEDDNQWTGDIAPPTPEPELRPQPHWPERMKEAVEHAVEEVVEEVDSFIEKVV